jgi:hypothetical protein
MSMKPYGESTEETMSDTAFLELLAAYEAALDAARRSLTIALALADSHRSGVRLPDAVLDPYEMTVSTDKEQPATLRDKIRQFKAGSGCSESSLILANELLFGQGTLETSRQRHSTDR